MPSSARYECIVRDSTGRSQRFSIPFPLSTPAHRAAAERRDLQLLSAVTQHAQKEILAAGPWVCECGAGRATRTVNTPSFASPRPGSEELIIFDVCCLMVCSKPACEQLAHRTSQEVIKAVHKQAEVDAPGTNIRGAQHYSCAGCGKVEPRDTGGFRVCGRCRAMRYCSKDCQILHWKAGHKRECAEPSA